MKDLLKQQSNLTRTENDALAYHSSGNELVNFFGSVGALRHNNGYRIIEYFERAIAEDLLSAVKIAFYARDIRGGLGERRVFRILLTYLAANYPNVVAKNIHLVPEYGRYDDLLVLLNTPAEQYAVEFIKKTLTNDLSSNAPTLLAKWLPSVNTTAADTIKTACYLAQQLGMSKADYRKALSLLRRKIGIVENNLRERSYTFKYSALPGRALFKYRQAFGTNDAERFAAYLRSVKEGEESMHTSTLYPYDVVRRCMFDALTDVDKKSLDVTWNSMVADNKTSHNAIAVVDGSGSMMWGGNPKPIEVALSLGLFFAACNSGRFANSFITFSSTPRLVELKGNTIFKKVRYAATFCEVANTDIQAVFTLILKTAVKNKVPPCDMPETIYIISDMEFDYCADNADETVFANSKRRFAEYGYALPKVVFWNVNARNVQVPVTSDESGAILLSGCTPSLFKMALADDINPLRFMLNVLNSPRYNAITV